MQQCFLKKRIVAALYRANIDNQKFPWDKIGAPVGIKRWPTDTLPIPVYFDPQGRQQDERVSTAIDEINDKLSIRVLILKTGSITAERQRIATGRGVILVRFGTALGEYDKRTQSHKPAQGHVGEFHGGTAYPNNHVENGVLNGMLCVNIDGKDGYPRATTEVVMHEFGHALGLGCHFKGFGEPRNAPPIDKRFWQVLLTLYSNEPKAQREAICVPDRVHEAGWPGTWTKE